MQRLRGWEFVDILIAKNDVILEFISIGIDDWYYESLLSPTNKSKSFVFSNCKLINSSWISIKSTQIIDAY